MSKLKNLEITLLAFAKINLIHLLISMPSDRLEVRRKPKYLNSFTTLSLILSRKMSKLFNFFLKEKNMQTVLLQLIIISRSEQKIKQIFKSF